MPTFNRALTIVATTLAFSVAANAVMAQGTGSSGSSPSKYSFIEGRFIADAEFDNWNDDADGFRFAGSYRFNKQIYGVAEYEMVEFDDSDADLDILRFGAGYVHPLNQMWDANFEAHLIRAEYDWGPDDDDETGFSIAGGARGMVTPEIQIRGMLVFEDIEDRDSYITLGADYFFQSNLSAGIELDLAGDYETFSFGARYYF